MGLQRPLLLRRAGSIAKAGGLRRRRISHLPRFRPAWFRVFRSRLRVRAPSGDYRQNKHARRWWPRLRVPSWLCNYRRKEKPPPRLPRARRWRLLQPSQGDADAREEARYPDKVGPHAVNATHGLQGALDGSDLLRAIHAADAEGLLDGSDRNWEALLRYGREASSVRCSRSRSW